MTREGGMWPELRKGRDNGHNLPMPELQEPKPYRPDPSRRLIGFTARLALAVWFPSAMFETARFLFFNGGEGAVQGAALSILWCLLSYLFCEVDTSHGR